MKVRNRANLMRCAAARAKGLRAEGLRAGGVANVSKKRPLKLDPTRTSSLRKSFTKQVRKGFATLRIRLVKLIIDEDALGLKESVHNRFCPTGAGGGIDPTCGPGGQASPSSPSGGSAPRSLIPEPPTPAGILASLGKAGRWLKGATHAVYKRLEGRYGKVGATAIFLSGQAISWGAFAAGAASGVVVYIPSAVAMAPGAAIAEVVRSLGKGVHNIAAALTPQRIQELAHELVKEIMRLWANRPEEIPDSVDNAFCPTGEGGGVDPSCAPSGVSVHKWASEKYSEVTTKLFGKKDPGAGIREVLGATKDAQIKVSNAYVTKEGESVLVVDVTGEGYTAARTIHISASGDKWIENHRIDVKEGNKGLGTKVFARQVEGAVAHGFSRITTIGSGADGDVGDKVLPKWGFSKHLTREGKLIFDLSAGSKSRQVLKGYLEKKGVQNVFCPTGPGGGTDPSCSPSSSGGREAGIKALDSAPEIKVSKSDPGAPREAVLARGKLMKTPFPVEASEKVGAEIRRAMSHPKAKRTTEQVKLSSLTARQSAVAKDSVRHFIESGDRQEASHEQPVVVRIKGKNYLHDGTHRATADLLVGKESTKATVYTLDKKTTRNSKAEVENTRWKFTTSAEKVKAFQEWLKTQYKGLVTGATEEQLWEAYIQDGYRKGAGRAFDDTKAPLKAKGIDDVKKMGFYEGTRDQFLRSAFGQPETKEKVALLAGRAFDDLEGITADMSLRMSRKLTDGLVQGKNPREIARDLDGEVDIGRARAETIARNEIIRAHAEGQLDAMEQLGVEEVGVAVEWDTADDDNVCELCEPLEGVVLKIDEARGMLPRHPGCRCAWIPANVGESKEEQKDTKGSISGALRASTKKGGDGDEWGPGTKISEDRPESILNCLCQFDGILNALTTNRSTFFADCERDERGHCLPGGAGGARVSDKVLLAAQAKAREKAKEAPIPTQHEVAHAKRGIKKLGANKYRRNLVGNTKDRLKRREALLKEFGDGRTCPCVYCGIKVSHGTMEQDKIKTTAQGGRYRTPNLVPSCSGCNKERGDTPWEKIKWPKG